MKNIQDIELYSESFYVGALFPNPTTSFVYLEGDIPADAPWQLFSAQGQLLHSGQLQQPRLDLRGLKSGVYYLKVGIQMEKIVKTGD